MAATSRMILAVVHVWSLVASSGAAVVRVAGSGDGEIAGVSWGGVEQARMAFLSLRSLVQAGKSEGCDLGQVLGMWLSPELAGAVRTAAPVVGPCKVCELEPQNIAKEIERLLVVSHQLN